jgi:hypothetical protein
MLYRRRRRECKAGHPEQSFSTEFEERKRRWTAVTAPELFRERFRRSSSAHSANLWEWDAARAIAAQFEETENWSGNPPEPPQAVPVDQTKKCAMITDACKLFLDELIEAAAFATHKKCHLLMAQLVKFPPKVQHQQLNERPTHIALWLCRQQVQAS